MLNDFVRTMTFSFLGIKPIQENRSLPIENREKFVHCLYPGAILVLFYLGFGIHKFQAISIEIVSASSLQPNRLPYTIVMYFSLELLLILSAYRTSQAMRLLYSAGPILTSVEFEKIFLKTRDSIVIAFFWACAYLLGDGILSFLQSVKEWLSLRPGSWN